MRRLKAPKPITAKMVQSASKVQLLPWIEDGLFLAPKGPGLSVFLEQAVIDKLQATDEGKEVQRTLPTAAVVATGKGTDKLHFLLALRAVLLTRRCAALEAQSNPFKPYVPPFDGQGGFDGFMAWTTRLKAEAKADQKRRRLSPVEPQRWVDWLTPMTKADYVESLGVSPPTVDRLLRRLEAVPMKDPPASGKRGCGRPRKQYDRRTSLAVLGLALIQRGLSEEKRRGLLLDALAVMLARHREWLTTGPIPPWLALPTDPEERARFEEDLADRWAEFEAAHPEAGA